MKIKFIFLLLVSISFIGCSSMNENYKTKLDSGLRGKLESKSTEQIHFFGKCKEDITPELKSELEKTGIEIETVTKNIFTASGTIDQIVELAKLKLITNLEESKENFPLGN